MKNGEARPVSRVISLVIILLLAQMFTRGPLAAKPKGERSLHEPSEIMKIMEDSDLTYEIGLDETLTPAKFESPRILSDQMLLIEQGDKYSLSSYELSAEGNALLKAAEESYEKKEFESALGLYARLQKREPAYGHASVLVGDVFYAMGEYEKARRAFEVAIRSNFADYQAHWFLGDALWKLGDQAGAIRSLTTAHLLNVNHRMLRDKLLSCRIKAGRPWKEWTYEPLYALRREEGKIKVLSAGKWLGYAMVKAVWAFEPGYARDMAGPDYEKNIITLPEEQEALVAALAMNDELKHLEKIIGDGYGNELIYYEMLAPRAPEAIVLFPRPAFMRLVHYVDTYH